MIHIISAIALLSAVFAIGLVIYTVCRFGINGSKNKEGLR